MNAPVNPNRPASHVIRLGSQWDLELLPETDRSSGTIRNPATSSPTPARRLKSIADWRDATGVDHRGSIHLVRSFGRPTGLASGEIVRLLLAGLPASAEVTLNDEILAESIGDNANRTGTSSHPFQCEVTALLQDRNRLAIRFEWSSSGDTSTIMRDAWLEISPSRAQSR